MGIFEDGMNLNQTIRRIVHVAPTKHIMNNPKEKVRDIIFFLDFYVKADTNVVIFSKEV